MLSVTYIPSTPYEKAWNGAFIARLNVIYYQRLLRSYENADRSLRIASLLLSSLGVGLSVKYGPPWLTMAAGGCAAVLSAFTLVMQLPEKARTAGALLPLFVQHHSKLSRLVTQGDDADAKAVDKALTEMDETLVIEAEKIKHVDEKLRREAQATLHIELGAPAPA